MRASSAHSRKRAPLLLATGLCCTLAAAAIGCGGGGGKTTATTSGSTATTGGAPDGEASGSREVSAHEVRASSGALSASLRVAGGLHNPWVGESWPIAFSVSDAGRPARAEVAYEYLFDGAVVAHRSHYRFTGVFHDIFKWPSSAVGYPLTFRAVITSSGQTLNLDYAVQVRR